MVINVVNVSRAVLGEMKNNAWKCNSLTEDHQPINMKEYTRLIKEHPNEKHAVRGGRVLGVLMPSRGLIIFKISFW